MAWRGARCWLGGRARHSCGGMRVMCESTSPRASRSAHCALSCDTCVSSIGYRSELFFTCSFPLTLRRRERHTLTHTRLTAQPLSHTHLSPTLSSLRPLSVSCDSSLAPPQPLTRAPPPRPTSAVSPLHPPSSPQTPGTLSLSLRCVPGARAPRRSQHGLNTAGRGTYD